MIEVKVVIDLMPKISETIPPAMDPRNKNIPKEKIASKPVARKPKLIIRKIKDKVLIIVPASALPKPTFLVLPTGIF